MNYTSVIETIAFASARNSHRSLYAFLEYLYSRRIIEYPQHTWEDFFLHLPKIDVNNSLAFMRRLGLCQGKRPKMRASYRNHSSCSSFEYSFKIDALPKESSLSILNCISHVDSFGLYSHQTTVAVAEHCTILKSPLSIGINLEDISLEEVAINAPELFLDIKQTHDLPTIDGSSIVLLNQFGPNYFHTLIETAARLYIVANSIGINESIQFLVDGPVSAWHCRLVETLLRPFRQNKILYINYGQYYHPGPLYITPTRQPVAFSAQYGKLYLQKWVARSCFRKNDIQASHLPEIIYIRRGAKGPRFLANQAQLEELVLNLGGGILDSDRVTLEEQWSIVGSAKTIIGVHGAGLANMVFMKKKSLVIELTNLSWKSDLYPAMALALGLRHIFVDCNPLEPIGKNAPLYIDIAHFKRLLDEEL